MSSAARRQAGQPAGPTLCRPTRRSPPAALACTVALRRRWSSGMRAAISAVLVWLAHLAAAAAPSPAIPGPAGVPGPAAGAARVELATVEQPRAYGYTIGDLLRQRVALGTAARPFVLAELPPVGRVGSSLWRRRSDVQTDTTGRRWLLQEYQLINAPQALSVWYLPALRLKSAHSRAVLAVPYAPFSIAPFTPPQPFEESALPALQPDAGPAPVPLAPVDARIRTAAAALAGVLLLWAGASAWRYLRRGRHLPFARALRDLRTLPAHDALGMRRRLHRALNESAGEVVRPGSVDRLLVRTPYLAAERDAVERFLRDSQAVFFAGYPVPPDGLVEHLAGSLRKLERRHVG